MAAGDEVGAALGAERRDPAEVAGADREIELGQRLVGGDVEIGRRGAVRITGAMGHLLGNPHMPCF